MVVFLLQSSGKCLHYVLTKPNLSCLLFARVNFKFGEVSIAAISQYPHLDPPFDWLHRHVLLEGRPPLELNHSLIHCHVLCWLVHIFESLTQVFYEGADLPQPVIRGITSWSKMVVVHKVQVPGDVTETLPWDSVCNRGIEEVWISAPVVINGWQVVDPHEDRESKEGLELFHCDWTPLLVRLFTHDLPGILVALLYYLCLQTLIKEELKDILRCIWDVHGWSTGCFEWLDV